MDEPDFLDDEDVISKTQRKKEAHDQQKLGERLTQLSETVLGTLPISDRLLAAILEFKRLPPKRGAVKRQLQFIGKLMRKSDVEEILAILDKQAHGGSSAPAEKETAQGYYSVILNEGDDGIQQVLAELPELDRQQIRQFLRNIQNAKNEAKKTAAEQRLHDLLLETCRNR